MDVRRYLLLILGLAIVALKSDAADVSPAFESPRFPKIVISNGILESVVLLPNPETGYYRGPRFDWSGLVARVKYEGHTYFGEWKTPHDPEGHDDVVGPAEEFGMGRPGVSAPLGYEEAKPGGTFIKIGIGSLEKIEEPSYRFEHSYRIVKPGSWEIRSGTTWVEFHQELRDESGWGYSYTKRVSLPENRPELVITHSLQNTGSKPIVQTQYCHNFSIIDDDPIGPNYTVRFPFMVEAKRDLGKLAEAHGNAISFLRTFKEGDVVFTELGGFSGSASDNEVIIENLKAGAGVRIKGDRPVVQFHLFAVATAACPEPFIQLELAPGEHEQWETRYTFFQLGARER